MMIANFTEEPIKWMHGGRVGTLEPDQIEEFDDARGNHILNKLNSRGLLRVEYKDKDDLDELRTKARQVNKQFWTKQVTSFNQLNESLKNENKPYIFPQPQVEEAAERLGLELVGPWKVKAASNADNVKLKALESEVSELKNAIAELISGAKKSGDDVRLNAIRSLYADLGPKQFQKFVEENTGAVLGWPMKIREELKERWDRDVPDEVWPLE